MLQRCQFLFKKVFLVSFFVLSVLITVVECCARTEFVSFL